MKKILIIIGLLLSFTIPANAYQSNMKIEVELKDQDFPVSGMGVQFSVNGSSNGTKIYLTNEKGIFNLNYLFDSSQVNRLSFILNGNYLNLDEIEGTLGKIQIDYNKNNEEIRGVKLQGGNGKISFSNQEIILDTNYQLLLIYLFFSIGIFSIIGGGRFIYTLLNKDIYKHIK